MLWAKGAKKSGMSQVAYLLCPQYQGVGTKKKGSYCTFFLNHAITGKEFRSHVPIVLAVVDIQRDLNANPNNP